MAIYLSNDHPQNDLWWFFVLEKIVHGREHPDSFNMLAEKEKWSNWWHDYCSQV
jgi:hypothetical protein